MEWLKNIREKLCLTQSQIAEKVNISQQFYGFIETGERRPSVETAKKIAEVLGFEWTKFYES